jgi:predicted outer membrane repeat protein
MSRSISAGDDRSDWAHKPGVVSAGHDPATSGLSGAIHLALGKGGGISALQPLSHREGHIMKKLVAMLACLALFAAAANAAEHNAVLVSEGYLQETGEYYSQWQIVISLDSGEDWCAAELTATIDPSDGLFYQHAFDADPPNPILFPVFPDLEYTSYYTSPWEWPNTSYHGNVVAFVFKDDTDYQLSAEWFDTIFDPVPGYFVIAQITVLPATPDDWSADVSVSSWIWDVEVSDTFVIGSGSAGGACCFFDGYCEEMSEEWECWEAGGDTWIPGVDCDPNPCPWEGGACCLSDGTCVETWDEWECFDMMEGIAWLGGERCYPNPCEELVGACCFSDGSCQLTNAADCASAGGTSWLPEYDCSPNPCPPAAAPVAEAGGPYGGLIGDEITLDASRSYDDNGTIVGYRWDWTDDGSWDTDWLADPTSTHTYDFEFHGHARVEVIDNDGATDDDIAPVNTRPDAPTTIYVDDDAAPVGDGCSWDTAYNDLQVALSVAIAGDEFHVAGGIYKPTEPDGQREATFRLFNGVALLGGYAGSDNPGNPDERDIALYETTLSGDLNGDDEPDFENNDENSYHVVTGSGTDETAVLDGFTVVAGHTAYHDPYYNGAGMYIHNASPTVSNCTFRGNMGAEGGGPGGGMYIRDGSPTLTGCIFVGNYANAGGGLENYESSPTLVACTFDANRARLYGGAIYSSGSNAVLVRCSFFGNYTSIDHGGAVYVYGSSDNSRLINCVLIGNTAAESGGGVYCYHSHPALLNCVFTGNAAGFAGGGCFVYAGGAPILTNCTFAADSAPHGTALACDSYHQEEPGAPTMMNCILWDGGDEVWNNDDSVITIAYCDVQGGWPGDGNIDDDPLFVDFTGGDLHLAQGSPCIDAGDNTAVPPDEFDLDADGDTTEPLPFDLDGNPRFVDDLATPDTGNGDPPIVDMGAYEFQGGAPIPGDLDGDGDVDLSDLAQLLSNYGMTEGATYEDGDLDGDGDVDLSDLAGLLANYGAGT